MPRQQYVVSDDTVRAIVDSGDIYTFFQPVIDLSRKEVLGFEALNKSEVSSADKPVRLSELAYDECDPEIRVKIDRLCREKALEEFRVLHEKQEGFRLFLNVEASLLQFEQADFTYLIKQVAESGLPPEAIVIEVGLETVINHIPIEIDAFYKEQGFKTCVADVDVSHPFLDCLLRYEPTYMKVDSSFLPAGPNDMFRTKLLSGLMDYSRKSGTTVVGMDVDSLNESVRLLHSGIVHQQGRFFHLARSEDSIDSGKQFFNNIEEAYAQFRDGQKESRSRLRQEYNSCVSLAASIASRLASSTADQYALTLETQVNLNPQVVMGYVLNDDGTQITAPVCQGDFMEEGGRCTEAMPQEGADHSVEEFYMHLDAGAERFVSPSYFSSLAGMACLLVARSFFSRVGLRYVLVLEIAFPG